MIKEIRQFKAALDMEKVRAVAMNPDLAEADVFDFGVFVIAKSGVNRNHSDITPAGQKAAVNEWIGKPIYYRDHETETANQIGRIYAAWVEDRPGETVTLGRGYGVRTDDHRDIFARIESGIHREMSCAYEPTKSVCSLCGGDLTGERLMSCPNGHQIGRDGVHARDLAFQPDHISFVGRPAVEGAGLIAADAERRVLRAFGVESLAQAESVRREAEDGRVYREMVAAEFGKWFGLANPDLSQSEIDALSAKLSAKEMARFARIERQRILPTGGGQMTAAPVDDENQAIEEPVFASVKDLFQKGTSNATSKHQ